MPAANQPEPPESSDIVQVLQAGPAAPDTPRRAGTPAALESDDFPSDWLYRSVSVAGQAVPLDVPRYIVRIDIDRPKRGATHGWQVRYRSNGTRLFSDSLADRKDHIGTPAESLHAAKAYLRHIWRGPKVRQLPTESASKSHPTGLTGVRIVWRKRGGMLQCYVRADDTTGRPLANLYVGTENTFKRAHLARRLKEAKKLRLAFLEDAGLLKRLPARKRPRA